jgi:hypothetical protein
MRSKPTHEQVEIQTPQTHISPSLLLFAGKWRYGELTHSGDERKKEEKQLKRRDSIPPLGCM